MEDLEIVARFWNREESAIVLCEKASGSYCRSIALHILEDVSDAEECVNDTYQAAWDSIPPNKPVILSTYLGKLTRRISLKRLRSRDAQKRGSGQVAVSLEELAECIPGGHSAETQLEYQELVAILNQFLSTLPPEERRVFLRRYWHAMSIREICDQFHFSKSKVESMLHRTRKKLRSCLEKEGYGL